MNEYENEQNINRREGANSSAVETPCFNPRGFRTAAFRVYSAHLHTSGLGGCHPYSGGHQACSRASRGRGDLPSCKLSSEIGEL